ncbi:MAG: hypothetical protein MUF04_14890 [Akkermansiaceae bacterium]|nr:hypothetical protein [Akkermansiaceae bacterium]
MFLAPKPQSALLIVGHGSTQNPDSSTPYFDHAEEIRSRGIFGEVHCCFWKEEPAMTEVDYLIDAEEVYVVPDFISEGYFTQEIIPRELRLTGPTTTRGGKTFHYCPPVGIHPSMTGLLLRRARETAPDVDPGATTLIITGHGTSLNDNSTKAIHDQVELIARSDAGFAAVRAAFMEQEPFVAQWDGISPTPNVRDFALLTGLEATVRGTLISAMPLAVYDVLGSAESTSAAYFVAGIVSLIWGLFVPWGTRFIARQAHPPAIARRARRRYPAHRPNCHPGA